MSSIQDAIINVGQHSAILAHASTTAALPACTYANGTLGVGATLTADANGAIAAQDGVTLVANDVLLVQHQAAPAQNGAYTVTQVGTAGTPFILTRQISANNASRLGGCRVHVISGDQHGESAAVLNLRPSAITVGTTGLTFDQNPLITGGPRYATVLTEEFTGGTVSWETNWRVSQTGAGATLAQDSTLPDATHFGVAALPTGTTATGRCGIIRTPSTQMAYTLSTSSAMYIEWLVYISALSDGTDTYTLNVGWGNDPAQEPASGAYFQYNQATSANWLICGANSSVRTRTTSTTAVVAGAWVRLGILKPAGTTTCEFFVNGVSLGTVSTNIPTVAVSHAAAIFKSVGTTSRILYLDYMWAKSTWATPRAT